jgi:polysaccharide export outer membrane protein
MPLKRLALFLAMLWLASAAHSQAQAVLRSGDIFELHLGGMAAEFSQEFSNTPFTVADNGTVDIPYLGTVTAAGISTTQFAHNVEAKLKSEKIFTNPTVTLAMQPQSRFITIGGGVRAPSTLPWSPDLTLDAAVIRAGGPGDFGDIGKIRITRNGQSSMFNLKKKDKDPNQNPKLLPGDVIEVKGN